MSVRTLLAWLAIGLGVGAALALAPQVLRAVRSAFEVGAPFVTVSLIAVSILAAPLLGGAGLLWPRRLGRVLLFFGTLAVSVTAIASWFGYLHEFSPLIPWTIYAVAVLGTLALPVGMFAAATHRTAVVRIFACILVLKTLLSLDRSFGDIPLSRIIGVISQDRFLVALLLPLASLFAAVALMLASAPAEGRGAPRRTG